MLTMLYRTRLLKFTFKDHKSHGLAHVSRLSRNIQHLSEIVLVLVLINHTISPSIKDDSSVSNRIRHNSNFGPSIVPVTRVESLI